MIKNTLYYDGKPIGSLQAVELTSPEEQQVGMTIHVPYKEAQGTFDISYFSPFHYLALCGIHVTNNYLKMHGGVLVRKAHLRRGRKKRP